MPRQFDVVEICQEAADQAGIEFRAGYDLVSARRSLELLAMEWANRGFNLWTLDPFIAPVARGVRAYVLPEDTIDVVDVVLRNWVWTSDVQPDRQQDRALERIRLGAWPSIAFKRQLGTPTSFIVNRVFPPELILWPTPDRTGELVLYRLRHMAELAPGGAGYPDGGHLPLRFYPALVLGLAFKLALKSKGQAYARAPQLKALYEEEFDLAAGEDRDRASAFFVPVSDW